MAFVAASAVLGVATSLPSSAQPIDPSASAASEAPRPVWVRTRSLLPGMPTQVTGSLASDDPRFSRVIFATADGRHLTFGVGDQVAPGISVDAIERDYVVLNTGGRPQILRLRHGAPAPEKLALVNPPSAQPRGGAVASYDTSYSNQSVADRLAQMRASVSATPAPLPPTGNSKFEVRRGRDSEKLSKVPVEVRDED